jgi:rhamnose transport system permease protein
LSTVIDSKPTPERWEKLLTDTNAELRSEIERRQAAQRIASLQLQTAEAVRQAGRKDVNVIGLSLPNLNKNYVHTGVVQTVVLWNTADLGYLSVYAGAQLARGQLAAGASGMDGGRLGKIDIRGSEIILGPPLKFTKANIDKYDF